MKVSVLEKNKMEMKFVVEGIKPSFASALRRTMMSEVPTMAIETVDFKDNDSALNDEIVANRLGLVPLTFDQDAYELPNCGKLTSKNSVKLVLKKKGPGMVYSGDMKSDDKDVKPVYDKIPIVELFENQQLQFEATAILGVGREHVKWQGAVVGYSVDEKDPQKFTFNVESVSGLPVDAVVQTAGKILEEKFSEFSKLVKKLK